MTDREIKNIINKLRGDIERGAEGLVFDPVPHTYHYNGKEMKSVSEVCEMFEAPFDSEYWSKKKAEQAGVTKEEILESWTNLSSKACDEGTEVHAYGEYRFYEATGLPILDPDIKNIETAIFEGKLVKEARMRSVDDCWDWLLNEGVDFKLYPVAAENRIVNPRLGYAGTFDLLFLCVRKDGRYGLIIFDYKTNKNLFNIYRPRGGKPVMMQDPFINIPDCNAAHYSCQLSLYQLGLRRVTDIPIIGRVLLWVNPLGVALIDKNDKEAYKEAHKRIEAAGEKSKWKYFSSYTGDIDILKQQYGFKRIKNFGMVKLPYLGENIQRALQVPNIENNIIDKL